MLVPPLVRAYQPYIQTLFLIMCVHNTPTAPNMADQCTHEGPPLHTSQVSQDHVDLHYHSVRTGMYPVMEGALAAVAEQYYGIHIDLKMVLGRPMGTCDHEV